MTKLSEILSMDTPEADAAYEPNDLGPETALPPIDAYTPDWSTLMINPSEPSVVASLCMEVDRIAPVLGRAMESAKGHKPYWASYSPHDVLALDMQFAQLTIALRDRRATGEETILASRVWQSLKGKLRHEPTRLNQLAWKTLHDDPWSWPYSARLLEEHGLMSEANAVRAFLFGYACLVANVDQHLLDVEYEGLQDLYKRLYGEQAQMPDLPSGVTVAESLQPPADIKPDPDMPVQVIFDNALYALARYNLDLLAPKIERHIEQEYSNIRYNLGYSFILQDLLQVYIAVVGGDGKLTMGESAVWQVLNQLAHENRLGNLESLLQEARAQQAFRSLPAIVQYDIIEGTDFTQTLRTFLVEFARIAARKDGLSTIEEQEISRLETEIDDTIAQIQRTSTQLPLNKCTGEDAQHPSISEAAQSTYITLSDMKQQQEFESRFKRHMDEFVTYLGSLTKEQRNRLHILDQERVRSGVVAPEYAEFLCTVVPGFFEDFPGLSVPAADPAMAATRSDAQRPIASDAVQPAAVSEAPVQTSVVERTANTDELAACLAELQSLIGLATVKSNVTTMINFLQIQQQRQAHGLKPAETTLHMVFKGNPGTGKTTVARLLAKIYWALGMARVGHLVEVDRTELIGEFLGQTAPKVEAVVQRSLGGVLFIDEAYSLFNDDRNDPYGKEAVSTLLKLMEDHRDDLIVIVAGYPDEMDEFISSNPGLKSRFTEELIFEDYTPQELCLIFNLFCAKAEYQLAPAAASLLQQIFSPAYQSRDRSFGNARFARNLFDDIVRSHANRLASIPSPTPEMLCTIQAEDVLPYLPIPNRTAAG